MILCYVLFCKTLGVALCRDPPSYENIIILVVTGILGGRPTPKNVTSCNLLGCRWWFQGFFLGLPRKIVEMIQVDLPIFFSKVAGDEKKKLTIHVSKLVFSA